MNKIDYMLEAIKEAKKSIKYGDVPVGAVIVKDGEIIAKAHNKREQKKETIAHAEILAITKANNVVGDFRLDGCDIYITKEPCLMCMGAILSSRIRKIYYGARDRRFGTESLARENNFNHKCGVEGDILGEECEKLLTNFFKSIR
ncbi:MAG: nucleoside deaminase [Clostridiales bacterium]|nr:nucleoside deaminase [Clostridiales bacterium]